MVFGVYGRYTMCPVVMYDTGPTCPTASTLAQKLLVRAPSLPLSPATP